jgi:hypothetical protein
MPITPKTGSLFHAETQLNRVVDQTHPVDLAQESGLHEYMAKLFEYGRAKARPGDPWHDGPPGF